MPMISSALADRRQGRDKMIGAGNSFGPPYDDPACNASASCTSSPTPFSRTRRTIDDDQRMVARWRGAGPRPSPPATPPAGGELGV